MKFSDQQVNRIGFVEGNGTSTEKNLYNFIDKNLTPGKYSYRLKQIDFNGSFEYSQIIETDIEMPYDFVLYQNFPNPFNPSTKIKYNTPPNLPQGEALIQLKVFDILGNEIATLVNEKKSPGNYEVIFDADKYNLSSGIYFYQIKAGGYRKINKMILMK